MTVQEFCETVKAIKPNNFMAMNGAASGMLGTADSGTDAVMRMQQAAINFAVAYKDSEQDTYIVARKDIIGTIMVAHALDAITQETADELLDAIEAITKERS